MNWAANLSPSSSSPPPDNGDHHHIPTALALPAANAVTATRRLPPPCWTPDETVALIDAYRDKWYSLRRSNLRANHWQEVADDVASRCPAAGARKTAVQCRHKMEKLRQRYRAEKQRALSFPSPAGRYFSSWFFFENMEAMENGTTPPTSVEKPDNPSDGSRLNSFIDQSVLKLKLKSKSNPEPSPDLGFDNSVQANRLNPATKIPIEYSSYLDTEIDDKEEDDLNNRGIRYQQMNRIPIPVSIPPLKSRSKKYSKMVNNFDGGAGFRQQMPPPGLRIKKLGSDYNRSNPNEVFFASFPNSNNSDYSSSNKFVDPGLRSKYWSNINPNSDPRSAIHGLKRGRNGLEEIVASIKLLGEGFVKMEKEKMEMAREIEGMRMEMEMKRNQMLLESQKQIVDAFLKGMFEVRKSKKVKSGVGVAPDSTDP